MGNMITGIVDTAAEVTVISKEFADHYKIEYTPCAHGLRGAGQGNRMQAWVAKGVSLTIGNRTIQWDVFVTTLRDSLLIGIDLLRHLKANINLRDDTVSIGNDTIRAVARKEQGGMPYSISRVLLSSRVALAPHTSVIVDVHLESPIFVECVIQDNFDPDTGVGIRETIVHDTDSDKPLLLEVFNPSDRYVRLQPNYSLGSAIESDGVIDEAEETWPTENIRVVTTEHCETEAGSTSPQLPAHLTDLFDRSSKKLNETEKEALANLLIEFSDVFSTGDSDLGKFSVIKHKIDTGTARPIRQPMRRTPLGFEKEEEKHLKQMLGAEIIQPSTSEWASPPVLVRKKDGSVRWCIDYRALNNVTVKDAFPMPRIEECLDTLAYARYMSTLDLASGYWQLEVDPADRHKTAFITRYGLYEHIRMGFGLCNAPATFTRAMQIVLTGFLWETVLAYLDDVIIVGKTFWDHLENIRKVLMRFRFYNLKLKPKKCILFQEEVKFLGRMVRQDGVSINPENIEKVAEWPVPICAHDVEVFLGFVNYHRNHIQDYAQLAAPLYQLTGSKGRKDKQAFQWTEVEGLAFKSLKEALICAPTLGFPLPEGKFIVDTDASDTAIGAVLSQMQEGEERVISYGSFVLTPTQRKYCTTRKELLAVVRFTRQYRHYLLGRQFFVRTDHSSLTWLMRFRNVEGQLARWLEELSQFDMTVSHRPGSRHQNADGLSRQPDSLKFCDCYLAGKSVETLPCGGCDYCTRAHNQWKRFEKDVDDVVPLAVRQVADANPDPVDCWVHRHTTSELQDMQAKDPVIGKLLQWTRDTGEPSQHELFLSGEAVKHFWINRQQLVIKSGLLYYRWEQPAEPVLQLMLPSCLVQDAIHGHHTSKLGGHFNHEKTLTRLRQRYMWYRMARDCKNYELACDSCGRNKKPNRKPKANLRRYHAGSPLERVHIDILGPFVRSDRGNQYILMIVDQFTKWVECFPLPRQNADLVARAMVDGFISREGCPLQIHTDQGRQFQGDCLPLSVSYWRSQKRGLPPITPPRMDR